MVFQLPNWVEAAITFWGAAQLGAVVVPIVHFYGPKEVGYVLDVVQPDVVVTAARFGQTDYLATYAPLLRDRTDTPWFVVGAERRDASRSRPPLRRAARGRADRGPAAGRPGLAGRHRVHLGDDPEPQGRDPLPPHARLRGPSAGRDERRRHARPPLTGAPIGHFIGMLNALLLPLLKDQAIHILDVWDPGEVLRIMQAEDIGLGGGAAFFVTSVLDHPDFTPAHLAKMPHRRHGRLHHPAGHHRAPGLVRHQGVPVLRQHRAPVDHGVLGPRPGAEAPRHRRGGAARGRDATRRGRRDLEPRSRPVPRVHRPGADRERVRRRGLVPHGRRRRARRRRVPHHHRPGVRHHHPGWREHQRPRGRGAADPPALGGRGGGRRRAATTASASGPRPSCGLLPGEPAPTLEDVRAHLAEVGLAKQKWPESIHPVVDLPRTPSGKVQKFKLRQQLHEGSLEHAVPSD